MHILFTLKKPCICEEPLHRLAIMDVSVSQTAGHKEALVCLVLKECYFQNTVSKPDVTTELK